MSSSIAILGCGSWGTALAYTLAGPETEVSLWSRSATLAEKLRKTRTNPRLPAVQIPESVTISEDLATLLRGNPDCVIITLPSRSLSEVAHLIKPHLSSSSLLISATKGIDERSGKTMSVLLGEILHSYPKDQIAALSGPSFAGELVKHQPTCVVIAAPLEETARKLQKILARPSFYLFPSTDVIGVELGGALKNVAAIAAGVSEGLHLGHNAKAAIVTLSLSEMQALGQKMGTRPETFLGLSGLGDLVLTCYGHLSRNLQTGIKLGQGEKLNAILKKFEQVVEGIYTVRAAHFLSQKLSVKMPVVEAVHRIVCGGEDPKRVIPSLFQSV